MFHISFYQSQPIVKENTADREDNGEFMLSCIVSWGYTGREAIRVTIQNVLRMGVARPK